MSQDLHEQASDNGARRARAPLRRWAADFVRRLQSPATIVGCAAFVQAFDLSSVSIALPDMAREFGGDALSLDKVIIAYLAGATAMLPLCGWATDRFGARRIFLAALALFGVAALACGLAINMPMLLAARVVQGCAGAMLLPVGRVIVLGAVEESKFVEAMAALTMPILLGPVIGPPLGGALVTLGSWRWLFLVMVPLAALGFILVLKRIEPVAAAHRDPLDIRGALLLAGGLAAVTVGIGTIRADLMQAALLTIAGAAMFAGYVFHEKRHATPILSLAPMAMPLVRVSNFGGVFMRMLTGATPFLLAILFQIRFGMNAAEAGGLILALALGSLAGRALMPALLRHMGFRRMLILNAFGVAASVAACGLFRPGTAWWLILGVLFAQGAMRSIQLIALTVLGYGGLSRQEFSAASTISSVSQQLSQSIGIATAVISVRLISIAVPGEGQAVAAAFPMLGLLSLGTLFWLWRMPANAGGTMAGRRESAPGSDPA